MQAAEQELPVFEVSGASIFRGLSGERLPLCQASACATEDEIIRQWPTITQALHSARQLFAHHKQPVYIHRLLGAEAQELASYRSDALGRVWLDLTSLGSKFL